MMININNNSQKKKQETSQLSLTLEAAQRSLQTRRTHTQGQDRGRLPKSQGWEQPVRQVRGRERKREISMILILILIMGKIHAYL